MERVIKRLKKIIGFSKESLINLNSGDFQRRLMADKEILYMAETFGACWRYDYQAAAEGRVGMHAILKCGAHSDIFFNAKIFLSRPNVMEIVSFQLALKYCLHPSYTRPDWVLGIPDGAKKLGEDLARCFKAKPAEMEKENGKLILKSRIRPLESVLIAEDLCTRGTGLAEAAREILAKQPRARLIRQELAVINRGGSNYIKIDDVREFGIISLARLKANDWPADNCPLCRVGSEPIKPKATDENWNLITNSQI